MDHILISHIHSISRDNMSMCTNAYQLSKIQKTDVRLVFDEQFFYFLLTMNIVLGLKQLNLGN